SVAVAAESAIDNAAGGSERRTDLSVPKVARSPEAGDERVRTNFKGGRTDASAVVRFYLPILLYAASRSVFRREKFVQIKVADTASTIFFTFGQVTRVSDYGTRMRAVAVMLTLCLSCMSPGLASSGDRSYVFFMCNRRCLSSLCNRSDNAGPPDWNKVHPVDMLEDTIHWHCPRECGYRCMWKTVEAFVSDGLPTPQFYGKWPFLRLLGIQEPASALLSALNLLIQFRYLALLCLQFDNRLPMFKYWIAQYLGSINAWLWSTVFHTCDVPFTEKMDYFSATAFVMASIITLQRRVFPKHPLLNYALPFIVMGIFLRYVNYMLVREFNYTYNMMFGVTFVICTAANANHSIRICYLPECTGAAYAASIESRTTHEPDAYEA
ncbi:post-GPI attachment to proteins factor 3, partial [Clonorchis sinensis]